MLVTATSSIWRYNSVDALERRQEAGFKMDDQLNLIAQWTRASVSTTRVLLLVYFCLRLFGCFCWCTVVQKMTVQPPNFGP